MQRTFHSYPIQNPEETKLRILHWAKKFDRICFLNSNEPESENDLIAAVGKMDEIICETRNVFGQLKKFYDSKKDWLFGFLTYDLKNELEDLSSKNNDGLHFPSLHFFQPEYVFIIRKDEIRIGSLNRTAIETKHIFDEISNFEFRISNLDTASCPLPPAAKISKEIYVKSVNEVKHHIQKGDIYELNFCQEFYSKETIIEPQSVYLSLNKISQTPFSAYYRLADKYLACASPERFLKKTGNKLISQPIKGTTRRGATAAEDEQLKQQLLHNEKERSENVMIVDLVRNDLSRIAEKGSVHAEELFGIYSFKQVHQMISTVSAELKQNIHIVDAIKAMFPMGSMTGAPKIRAMQLIEQYECTKRGLYSGAVGYITPEGDFDFNVVIRSILYNATEKYLSFMVGSAITANAKAEAEYEECLLKAKGMFEALSFPVGLEEENQP